eukprot:COSAG06_NODE_68635_length_211_cov_619.089286_1_plen_55_part_10
MHNTNYPVISTHPHEREQFYLERSIWNGTMAANPTARPHWTLKAFIICEGLAFCY